MFGRLFGRALATSAATVLEQRHRHDMEIVRLDSVPKQRPWHTNVTPLQVKKFTGKHGRPANLFAKKHAARKR